MKKWFKNLSKDQITRYIFVGMLVLVFAVFFISLSLTSPTDVKKPIDDDPITETPDPDNQDNPDNPVDPDDKKQDPEKETFAMPLTGDFKVVRKYYDATGDETSLELAVIQFGKKYYTSNGISLVSTTNKDFQVLASLSGEVTNVEESPIYGVVVTIKHDGDVYTEYSSLSAASVKKGDIVKQGDSIGVSGICEYDSSLATHVFFKVSKNNVTINPEAVMGKTQEDL